MDLSFLNNAQPGTVPGAYDNPDVETVVAFDEHGRPYYATVPTPAMVLARASQRAVPDRVEATPAPMVIHQPAQPSYGPLAAPSTYNPVRDPIVMRLLAGAVAVGTGAIALSFVLTALAAAETALGFLALVLGLIWVLTSGRNAGGKGGNITIHNTNSSRRWR